MLRFNLAKRKKEIAVVEGKGVIFPSFISRTTGSLLILGMLHINASGRFVACRTVVLAKEGMCTSLSYDVQN
jgi:hypothetical protein